MAKSNAERQKEFRWRQADKGMKLLYVWGDNGHFDPRLRLAAAVRNLTAENKLPDDVRETLTAAAVAAMPPHDAVERRFISKEIADYLNGQEKEREFFDPDLNPVLETATREELQPLVDLLTGDANNELSANEFYRAHSPQHELYADLIAAEIRRFGGHSLVNFVRGCGPTYREIVNDVAKRLSVPFNPQRRVADIEEAILAVVLKDAWEKMDAAEQEKILKETGTQYADWRAPSAFALAGIGGMRLAGVGASRFWSLLTGTVGLTLTALLAWYDIGKEAYRITVPAVIHIAMLRRAVNAVPQAPARRCPDCGAELPENAKFCPQCGKPVDAATAGTPSV